MRPLNRWLDFDISSDARRLWNRVAEFAERSYMSFDRFPNITFRLFKSSAGRDAAGQIGTYAAQLYSACSKMTAYPTLIASRKTMPPQSNTL